MNRYIYICIHTHQYFIERDLQICMYICRIYIYIYRERERERDRERYTHMCEHVHEDN